MNWKSFEHKKMESSLCLCSTAYPAFQKLLRAVKKALPDEYADRLSDALNFYETFFAGLPCQKDCWEDDWAMLSVAMMRKFEEKADEFEGAVYEMTRMDRMRCGLEGLMEECKPEVNQICILLLMNTTSDFSYSCKSTRPHYSQRLLNKSLIRPILGCLKTLRDLNLVGPLKEQVSSIEEIIELVETFLDMVGALPGELASHTRAWASRISHLVCFYLTAHTWDDTLADTTKIMLSDLMQRYMPFTPQVIALHLDLRERRGNTMEKKVTRFLVKFNGFLLQHLVSSGIEILHEGFLFLISLVFDLVTEESIYNGSEETKVIQDEIYGILITEVPFIICIPGTNFSAFLHRIDMVKIKVRDLFAFTPLPAPYEFPRDSIHRDKGLWNLDSFLTNLQGMLEKNVYNVSSIKNTMASVQIELASLCKYIQDKLYLKKEQKELQAIWTQAVHVTYFAGHVAYYCFSKTSSVWYGILCIPSLIEDVKLLKSKVREIEDGDAFLPRASASNMGELFISFNEEEVSIFNNLVSGSNNLAIISILGMGGQGKTTLAKMIYNHPSIHYHFSEKVWCSVSVQCNPETSLRNISGDLGGSINDKIEHSIEHVGRSLKGKRYLVVLDDVWDLNLWKVLQSSLPSDGNGSRILFTSRNADLVSHAESAYHADLKSFPIRLRFFTDDESWELIQKKVFGYHGCPPDLLAIGKKIAVSCKGLPLAVTTIASVLERKDKQLELWENVATNLPSYLASEGVTNILALSYEHLPDHLKPCFLYFGSFSRGQSISVKKLKFLWKAEGLVKWRIFTDAGDYLKELISHSLVVVAERGSISSMKCCMVHELLYDICLEKAVQDIFLHRIDGNTILGECYSSPQKHEFQFQHRLCIHQVGSFVQPKSTCIRKQSARSRVHSILWFGFYSNPQQSLSSFLGRFKVLTILDLEDLYITAFPQIILNNIHLRYLALRGFIEHIPLSIVDLCNLETLIVKRGCRSVVELPATFWANGSLEYVYIDWICLPNAAARQIAILGGIIVEYGVKVEDFMRKIKGLKCYCNGVLDPLWCGSLERLECLHIRNHNRGSSLMLPPDQSLPSFNFPGSLMKLVLEECGLPWSVISTIGSLPHLSVLKLRKWACVGTTWHLGDGKFPCLKHLELFNLDVERVDDSACKDNPPFWRLEKLLLISCLGLQDFPTCFLRYSDWLETIDVSGSSVSSKSMIPLLQEERVRIFGLEE